MRDVIISQNRTVLSMLLNTCLYRYSKAGVRYIEFSVSAGDILSPDIFDALNRAHTAPYFTGKNSNSDYIIKSTVPGSGDDKIAQESENCADEELILETKGEAVSDSEIVRKRQRVDSTVDSDKSIEWNSRLVETASSHQKQEIYIRKGPNRRK